MHHILNEAILVPTYFLMAWHTKIMHNTNASEYYFSCFSVFFFFKQTQPSVEHTTTLHVRRVHLQLHCTYTQWIYGFCSIDDLWIHHQQELFTFLLCQIIKNKRFFVCYRIACSWTIYIYSYIALFTSRQPNTK